MKKPTFPTQRQRSGSQTAQVHNATPKRTRKRGRPAQHEPSGEALKALVIQASRVVYAQHGYQGSSVARLLEAANISRPTFYRLFSGRHEVIEAIVTDANQQLRFAVFSKVAAARSASQATIAAVDAYFEWCEAMGSMVGPIYSEINDPESPASGQRQAMIREFVQLLHAQAKHFGQKNLDPFFYDTLVRAIEHAGSAAFWPQRSPDADIARHRAAAVHILTASLGLDSHSGQPRTLDSVANTHNASNG